LGAVSLQGNKRSILWGKQAGATFSQIRLLALLLSSPVVLKITFVNTAKQKKLLLKSILLKYFK
jgi:hypothetical protein